MSTLRSQSWITVEIRVPGRAKKAVRDTLGPFVLPPIQEKRAEEDDLWSIKGIVPADTSVDNRLVDIEQGLRQIEQTLDLDNALLVELGTVQGAGESFNYGKEGQTVYMGGRFVVAPPGNAVQAHQDRTVIRLTAGQAFGDGSHSSTQVALQMIDGLFRGHHAPPAPGWCLDAGCGTGVLALAVTAHWKGKVVAVDISAQAIERVKANLALNRPWSSRIWPVHGELSCCGGPFGVILANLVPSVQINAYESLWTALEPGGWLILAGFQETQKDLVAQLYTSKGAETEACQCKQGWMGLLLRKPELLNVS